MKIYSIETDKRVSRFTYIFFCLVLILTDCDELIFMLLFILVKAVIRGTQREYSSKTLNIALLNVFWYLNGTYRNIFIP